MDISQTIQAKSDQLNADDLIATPVTIKVSSVRKGSTDQPVIIDFEGDNNRPYKPCKSMRRLLCKAWGKDGSKYKGKRITLYCDETVKFAGKCVGGIRISHLSDIDEDMRVNLSVTRGIKKEYLVKKLEDNSQKIEEGEREARKGVEALTSWGKGLSKSDRESLDGEIKRLMAIAKKADEEKSVDEEDIELDVE